MNAHILRQILRAPAGEGEMGGESNTGGTLAGTKDKLSSTARDTAERIKSAAGDAASRAKAQAGRIASETKEDTAKRIGGYGSAMHESAKSFEQQDPNIAWATHRMADRIQNVANYLRDRNFNELKADAEDIARRHPFAFFGALFVGGVVLGNLLTARETGMETEEYTGWDRGNASGSEALSPTSETPMATGPIATGI